MVTILSILLGISLTLNILLLVTSPTKEKIENAESEETTKSSAPIKDLADIVNTIKLKRLSGLHPVNRDMIGECGNVYRRRGVANADETLVYTQDKENRIEFLIIDNENYMPQLKKAGIEVRILVETGVLEYTQEFWDNAHIYKG